MGSAWPRGLQVWGSIIWTLRQLHSPLPLLFSVLLEADLKYCITGFLILCSGLVWPEEDWLPRPEKDPSYVFYFSLLPNCALSVSKCGHLLLAWGPYMQNQPLMRLSRRTAFPNRSFDCFGVLCPSPVLFPSRPLAFQAGVPIFPGRARHFVACLAGKGLVFLGSRCPLRTGGPSLSFGAKVPKPSLCVDILCKPLTCCLRRVSLPGFLSLSSAAFSKIGGIHGPHPSWVTIDLISP